MGYLGLIGHMYVPQGQHNLQEKLQVCLRDLVKLVQLEPERVYGSSVRLLKHERERGEHE